LCILIPVYHINGKEARTLETYSSTPEKEEFIEENKRLKLEIKKLNRQIVLANDNMKKYQSVSFAKENMSAVIAAEKTRQERQLRVIMDNSPDIVILLDRSMNFLLSTKSFSHIAEIQGLGLLFHKSFRQVFSSFADEVGLLHMEAFLNKALETNTVQAFDEKLRIGNSESTRSYAVSVIPFAYDDAENDGLLVNFHDMTERIEMEDKIREALRDATVASNAKGDFLANMSHEIRTPMNAVIGMAKIGKTASDPERKEICFSKIEEASTHLLGIINDILDMSKIEANKLELSYVKFNFEEMLRKVVNVVSFRADEKQQKLSVFIDKTIPKFLIGDDQRLAQVITNLLGNAVKFTPAEGYISLKARFLGEQNDVCSVRIDVIDTGIGLSPEQQEQLFIPFQQAESNTSRKFGGTGLGLAISKRIVETMGGKIWAESELGCGSAFVFTIHMKKSEDVQDHLSHSGNWNNIRILAADGNRQTLDYIEDVLRGSQASCDTAQNGEDVLRLVKQNGAYDICFIDFTLPGIDGIEMIKSLQANGFGNDSISIMSASAEWSEIEEKVKKAGINRFLVKPLFPSDIINVINGFFGIEQKTEEKQDVFSDVFEGNHILLAEDVEINREIVMALLEPTQLKIDCAENGVEAVRMFNENQEKYDLIFMDLQMPEMDGFEAVRRIRSIDDNKAKVIPIVAMTANVFREDVEKCLAAGMNGHIGKPIDFDEVIKLLRRYLPKRGFSS